jgi:glutathione S-transferase
MTDSIVILGRNSSVNVQKVTWCAAELGLTVDRKDVGGAFGGNDTAEYLAMNPNGKIPVLIDGDHIMWESNAIVRYLVDQYSTGILQPKTMAARGIAQQWMDWTLGEFQAPMTVVFWTLIRTAPEDRDMDALAKGVKDAGRLLDMLDRLLADREFVAGDELSFGDIPVGGFVNRWFNLDIERPSQPNVERWYQTLSQRPGFREHVMLPLT